MKSSKKSELQSLEELNSQAKYLSGENKRILEEQQELELAIQRENNKTMVALEVYEREIKKAEEDIVRLKEEGNFHSKLEEKQKLELLIEERTKAAEERKTKHDKAARRNKKLNAEIEALEKEITGESLKLKRSQQILAKTSQKLEEKFKLLEEGQREIQNVALMPELSSYYQQLSSKFASLNEKIATLEKQVLKHSSALEHKMEAFQIESKRCKRLSQVSRRFLQLKTEGLSITQQQNQVMKENEIIKRRLELGEMKNYELIAKLARLDDQIFEKNKEEHQLLEELNSARAVLRGKEEYLNSVYK